MEPIEFYEVIRLVESTVALCNRPRDEKPATLQRELRALSLRFELLRIGLSQPPATLGRN